MLISKIKIIFNSIDTILKNREFPFFPFFHYTRLANDLFVTFKWHWGHIDLHYFFRALNDEHIYIGYMLVCENPLVKKWSVVYQSNSISAVFHNLCDIMTSKPPWKNIATWVVSNVFVYIICPQNSSVHTFSIYGHVSKQSGIPNF